ncbi:hypothetical protein ABT297_12345 [Dactylosporangium sp. NPDC000555]|uniref:hypothetical protein n=1 Tax=Dactylosporangium sp. NPDC000555 TaxID=3154260 RepID=UPI00331D9234
MNDSRLRLDMADLADQVNPVDLRDRALRTSRRLGIQRAVATSAAALVVLAGAAGIAFAVRPDGQGQAPIPGDSAVVTSAPVEPTHPASTGPSGSTDPTGSGSAAANAPQPVLTGTRWYLGGNDTELAIHAVRGDKDNVTARFARGSGGCVYNTITVSPDGKRLAWVDGADSEGTLMTAATDGSGKRTLDTGVLCLGAKALVWKGSDQLMVTKGSSQRIVNLVTGGSSASGDIQAWSTDGVWSAGKINDKLTVTNGRDRRYYQYTPPQAQATNYDGWAARGVSMDGRYVTVGWLGTDPSRKDEAFAVVDTTTSKTVQLPVAGGVQTVLFAADGTVLVRQTNRIVVLDAQFRKLGELAEPKGLQGMSLLAYAA